MKITNWVIFQTYTLVAAAPFACFRKNVTLCKIDVLSYLRRLRKSQSQVKSEVISFPNSLTIAKTPGSPTI